MIFGLFGRKRRNDNRRVVGLLYDALAAAGRQPALYEDMNVPDTVMGQFEMLAAHVILFLRRSSRGGEAVKAVGQDIVDEFFLDIDHSIRELGIGDVGVPKKMKKFGRMFYGRAGAYGEALDAGDGARLAEALRRNIHPDKTGDCPDMNPLARYLVEVESGLSRTRDEEILAGALAIPAVAIAAAPGEPA